MRVLSVFTVSSGEVRRGADIERHVLPSKRVISAVVLGGDKPAYVQVNGIHPRERGGALAPELRAASIIRRFPWAPELVLAPDKEVDTSCAIVVLRTEAGRENYHRGETLDQHLPGWTLAKGRLRPCRETKLGNWLGHGATQLVQCVPQGSVFSTIVNRIDGAQVVHSYRFNGETIELVPPAFCYLAADS